MILVFKDNFIKEFNIFDQWNIEFFEVWEKFDYGSFSFSTAHYSQIVQKFNSQLFLALFNQKSKFFFFFFPIETAYFFIAKNLHVTHPTTFEFLLKKPHNP